MLLCLDTASLYYRSFYALPDSMTSPDGRPHNAIRGLLSTMTRLVEQHSPTRIAACWDADWRPQWRVDRLPSYKTHRVAEESDAGGEETPDTLAPQIDAIAGILDALGVPRPGCPGFEADDVIATLAHAARDEVIVVTGDRDLMQVVRPGVRLLLAVNGGMEKWPLLDDDAVLERFGVPPASYVDLAVLRGDPSDGIPGVPGFGPKTAIAVLAAYGSIDAALEVCRTGGATRPLTARLAGLLLEHESAIHDMLHVARARLDAPVPPPAPLVDRVTDRAQLESLGQAWGVERFIARFEECLPPPGPYTVEE